MEVKKGYKQTEVGIVPGDWGVKEIGKINKIYVGRDLREENFSTEQDNRYRFPVYSNTIDEKGLYGFYDFEEYQGESLTVVGRGVGLGTAFTRNGSFGAIGRLLILFPDKNTSAHFLTEYINHRIKIFTESSGIPQLTSIQFGKYKVPIPRTKDEQTAIAIVLGDTDSLIDSLEKLVAKKRNIKQGTMQLLLTGKKRLPGFDGKWEVKKLGKICKILKGQLITEKTCILGNVPVIAGGKTPAYFHNRANRPAKTITISASGASAGYVAFHPYPIFASDCSTIEEGLDYSIEFIFYKLQLIQESIYKMQTGGAQPHIHPVDLYPIEFPIPEKAEQTEIAKVLSDMDAEIEALETKFKKYEMIKQGMMQELLTGKTRLI